MSRHTILKLPVLLAAAFACIPMTGAQTTLTISSWVPPTHLMTKDVTLGWAAAVEKVTEGRVKFQLLAKHPSAPAGAFDAVRDGLVDVTFTVPNYTPARFGLTFLAELPGGGTNALINSVAYMRIHWKHLDKAAEFKGVKLLSVFTHGPGQMFNTKRPIVSLADLKGLKFRTGGGAAEKMAQALGATSFVKPATESYELLSTGVADGIFFPLESVTGFKLEKVVKFGTLFSGGFYCATFAFIMNEDKWNKISKRDQDLIMSISGEHHARAAGKLWDDADRVAMDALKQAGVVMAEASPAFVKEIKDRAVELEQEWIKAATAKGLDGAKVLADFRAELAKVASEK